MGSGQRRSVVESLGTSASELLRRLEHAEAKVAEGGRFAEEWQAELERVRKALASIETASAQAKAQELSTS